MRAAGTHPKMTLPHRRHVAARPCAPLLGENGLRSWNGTQLNDNEEHVPELLGDIELDELVDENHVARRGHRQPLGDALDEAKERRF